MPGIPGTMALKISKWLVIAACILFAPSVTGTAPLAFQNGPQEPVPAPKELPEHLKPVCACESLGDPNAEPRQFNADGSVVHGPGNNWGICQINATAHAEEAKALGIDYMTREGNIDFALYLYSKRGYKPWYPWSGHCWENDPRIDPVKLQEARDAL